MEVFEVVIALLLGGAALAAVARRVGAPYPALVALAAAQSLRQPTASAAASRSAGRGSARIPHRARTSWLFATPADPCGTIPNSAVPEVQMRIGCIEITTLSCTRSRTGPWLGL